MKRPLLLSALVACVLVLGSVVAGCSADSDAAQALERSHEKSRTLGSRMTMNMTMTDGGQTVRGRTQAVVERGGRRMRMTSTFGGVAMEQYLDGSSMLMSIDSLPLGGASPFPRGTRWLKVDLDELLKEAGLDTSMRELQQMDPTKLAAMLKDGEIEEAGSGRVRGVTVHRYRATIKLEDLVKSLGAKSSEISKAIKDSTMTVTLALDDDDLMRAFQMTGDMNGSQMTMDAVVTSYSRDIGVDVPSGAGVYDATEMLRGASRQRR